MSHTCHWPSCGKNVPPKMWGCSQHWFALPLFLRNAIWKVYVPGQEIRKDPSEKYIAVAQLVQEWIVAHECLLDKDAANQFNPTFARRLIELLRDVDAQQNASQNANNQNSSADSK